jgi:hypothetical protein
MRIRARLRHETQRKNCRGRLPLPFIGADYRAPLKRGTRPRQVSRRARLDLLAHYVAGRTSVICAGLIDAVTLP